MTRTDVRPATGGPESAPPPDGDLTGQTLGDFQVLRRLGHGGMGQVYLAEQVSLKRQVALKLLKADLAANPTYLQRFKAEAEAVARATHANIVQVYAIGEAKGLHYMALEFVDGRNLRDYLAKKGPPELALALSIMRQAAAALQRAGELGIVHRDIKPENILLTRKGEVKVTDFGLSRTLSGDRPLNLTQSGVTMGTPLYMSPEQVQGQPLDPRTDIYSLGVTCFHMLAGHPPFNGETAFQVALMHVQHEPPALASTRPDLPAELCAVVHKMMAKNPDERYQTPRELLHDLARVQDGAGGPGTPLPAIGLSDIIPPGAAITALSTTRPGLPPAQKRGRSVWPAVAVLGLALGLGVAAGLFYHQLGDRPAAGAEASGSSAGAEDPGVEALQAMHKREQFLKEAVERYLHPADDNGIILGLGHCTELSLLYLEQRRLDEAQELFKRLDSPEQRVKRYQYLGRLGQAIVLAFRDQTAESNNLFLDMLGNKPPHPERPEIMLFLRQNPKLREMIGRALEHNYHNREQSAWPKELNNIRKAPGLAPAGRPGGPA